MPRPIGQRLTRSREVRYLGVILDLNLLWREHLRNNVDKVTNDFWACRRMVGAGWGLKPAMLGRLYPAIVRPSLVFTALVSCV